MRNLGLMDPAFLGAGEKLRQELNAANAAAYISAVEAADGQALETGVKDAINAFVLGCEADGIGNAIKASCILAGARTLAGALQPLVGTAPTNFNFVSGDYSRKTGLLGNGTTKYLNSNRNNNAAPVDNIHVSIYLSSLGTRASAAYLDAGAGASGATNLYCSSPVTTLGSRLRSNFFNSSLSSVGLFGASRSQAANYIRRISNTNETVTSASQAAFNGNITLFNNSDARLAFYSIGESLDLALLDARVTALVNALAVAIP
jgi:hypothetical protein